MAFRPVLPGQLVQVPGGIVTPGVAYITSAGNDTTGDGSINKPWRTAQKAADAGFYYWHLGANFNAGDVNFGGTDNVLLYLSGEGLTSTIGALANHGKAVNIYDIGFQSVLFQSIDTTGSPGGNIYLSGVYVLGSVSSGGLTASHFGGSITITNGSIVGAIIDSTGAAATVSSGSNGGNGGAVFLLFSSQAGGDIDRSGGAGDSPGIKGSDGQLSIQLAFVIGTITPDTADVQGAIIGTKFYANTYPATSHTVTPVTSVTTVADSVSAVS